mgnify:CR=1 FL=1
MTNRLYCVLIACMLLPVKVLPATIDSLFRKVVVSSSLDYRLANQLLVALDAEGVTDSLIVFDRHQRSDKVRQEICYYMGLFYNNTYRPVQAADAFTQAVGYAQLTHDIRREAECLSAAAVQYHKMGNFEHAIDRCVKALRIDSLLRDTVGLSCDLNILSGINLSAGHTDDALRYIMKAIEWEKLRANPTQIAIRYGSAAEILNKKGDTRQALHYATLAYEADKRAGNAIGVARRMSQMADIYSHLQDYDAARRYYERAIDTLEAHHELHSLSIDYRLLGNVLQMQGKHQEAIRNYLRAEELARQTGNRFFLSLVARSMAKSHQALGHTTQAFEYLQLALELGDSLHSEKIEQMAADFRTQFELQEEHEHSRQQQSLVTTQQYVIVLLSVLLIAFIFCLYTGMRFCDVKDLRYSNIDYANKLLRFEQDKTKGHSARSWVTIPLNDGLIHLVGRPKEGETKESLVFNLPSYESCCKSVKRWVKHAGIDKHISWHCARHSFAVNILNNGANIKTVASLLGHSGLKHTEKYTRAVDKLKEDAINSLPALNL